MPSLPVPVPRSRPTIRPAGTRLVAALAIVSAAAGALAPLEPTPVAAAPAAPGAVTEHRRPSIVIAAPAVVAQATAALETVATAAGNALVVDDHELADGAVVASEVGLDPFELLGVTLDAPVDPVLVRVRHGQRWGAWHELGFEDTADAGTSEDTGGARPSGGGATSSPWWVGAADGYQVLLPGGTGEPVVHLVRAGAVTPATTAEFTPAAVTDTTPAQYAASPGVRSRASWGARPMVGNPVEADDLRLAIVHHSVSVNGYTEADVPGMLRSIQAFHMDANGWSDVGYNFAVDRFGRIWELRAGGILNAVIGGHAQGFNTGSVGVVLLGDFSTVAPTTAATNAVAEIIAWRFAVAQADPRGTVDYTTVTGSTRYPPGTTVRLDRVSAHRDVGSTACPGAIGYGAMGAIRSRVALRYAALAGTTPTRWLTSTSHRYSDLSGLAVGAPDAAAPAEGDLDVFARGGDDQLFLTSWRGAGWSPWTALGGRLTSSPAAISRPGDDAEVYAIGGDGAVWFRRSDDGTWGSWGTLGGRLTSAPDVVRTADGTLVLAARGGDGAVWMRSRAPDGRWSAWASAGGGTQAGAAPGLVLSGATLTVLATGGDGALWTRTGRADQLDRLGPWQRAGGLLTSGVTGASAEPGRVDVVARGGDGRLWSVHRTGGTWSGWQQVSREPVGAGAGMTSWGPGRLDFATITPDGRIFQNWWLSPTGW